MRVGRPGVEMLIGIISITGRLLNQSVFTTIVGCSMFFQSEEGNGKVDFVGKSNTEGLKTPVCALIG